MNIARLELSRRNENDVEGEGESPTLAESNNYYYNHPPNGHHVGQMEEGRGAGGGTGRQEGSGRGSRGGRNSPGIDQLPVKGDLGKRRIARLERLGMAVPIERQNDNPMAATATNNPPSTRPGAYPSNGNEHGVLTTENDTTETTTPDDEERGEDDGAGHLLVANAVLFDPLPQTPMPPPPLVEASELPQRWSRKFVVSLVILLIVFVAALSTAIPLAILANNSNDENEDDIGSVTDSPTPNVDDAVDSIPSEIMRTEGPTLSPTTQIPTIPTLPPSIFDGEWILIGEIDGEAPFDESGWSVSLSSDGNILAIGAIMNDGNGMDSGHTRVFEYTIDDTWTQRGSDIDGEAVGDRSGRSVSLSSNGNILAVGAFRNDRNGASSGHTRVFEYTNGFWSQRGVDIDGEASGDLSGLSVSLSSDGNVLAIGAFRNDGNGEDSGHVRVFEYSGSAWVQRGDDIDGEAVGDFSGWSVSLSSDGSVLAIGATADSGNRSDSGHVRVYRYEDNVWTQKGGDIDGEAPGDRSGWSLSMSSDGNVLAIGADLNDGNGENSGHVRVYEFLDGAWTQRGDDIEGETAGDLNGESVALSSDGSMMAVGAGGNDGNGSASGSVRVYGYTNGSWRQRGRDIDGEAADDFSGRSLSMSSDGSVLAIGARVNDGNGENSGHVRVYRFG